MARSYHDPSGARAPLCEAEGLAVVPFFLSIVDTRQRERESAGPFLAMIQLPTSLGWVSTQ